MKVRPPLVVQDLEGRFFQDDLMLDPKTPKSVFG